MKNIFSTYVAGIIDRTHGESYTRIFQYLIPEYISALIVYSAPIILDSYFISSLRSTPSYAALGGTNNLLHFIIKIAEALPVATVILTGQFNGTQQYEKAGRVARDTFWVTTIVGFFMAGALYWGAPWLYEWYGFNQELTALSVPFLRVRAIGIFFMYVYFGLIGFLRGIKNTRMPMVFYVIGTLVFLCLDYALIFGYWGCPRLELMGSAVATVVQYIVLFLLAFAYIVYDRKNHKYNISLVRHITQGTNFLRIFSLSWPVMLDKGAMSLAYIWLGKIVCPLGTCAIASFSVVKDMERFALIPAVACAQVITFLVSNDVGLSKWRAIKTNIKKVLFIGTSMVFSILFAFALWSRPVIQFFDKQGDFTSLAAQVFPFLSVLAFFDVVQLILSASLRGAGDVRIVMLVRVSICFGFFIPVSYVLSQLQYSEAITFLLVYGSFYVGNALMSLIYISRLRSSAWHEKLNGEHP